MINKIKSKLLSYRKSNQNKLIKKKDFNDYIYFLFFFIFSVMFLYAVHCCIKTIYNPNYKEEYFFGIIFSGCIMIFFFITARNINKLNIQTEILYVFLIMLLCFILRWMSIMIIKTIQISDFAFANQAIDAFSHKELQDEIWLNYCRDYYTKYPAWFPYMRLISAFYDLFCGGKINTEAVKYLNAVLNTLTCGCIYYTARCLFSKKVGFISSMLYCCFPSLIVWTNIMTGDHVLMLLFCLQIIIWHWMWKKIDNTKVCIFLICLHSLICAFINWFKPLVILFLLVFIFFIFGTNKIQEGRKVIDFVIVYVISFLLCFFVGSKILNIWVESYIQQDVVDSTWQYIYAGITMNEDGSWNAEDANEFMSEILQSNKDIKQQQNVFKEAVLDEIRSKGNKLPILFLYKYKETISYEGASMFWANTNSEDEYSSKLNDVLGLSYYFVSNGYYLLLLILVVCCCISQFFIKNENIFPLALIVVGFLCIQVLSVVQGRYKYIIMPYFVILSAYGLESIRQIILYAIGKISIKKWINKREEK